MCLAGMAAGLAGCGEKGTGVKGDFPKGTEWICTNAACTNLFMVTMKELARMSDKYDGDVTKIDCPKCKQRTAMRSDRCAECGVPIPAGNPYKRPLCEKHKDPNDKPMAYEIPLPQ